MSHSLISRDSIELELEQLNFQFDKSIAILNSFERDWNQITQLSCQIEEDIKDENATISQCKSDLNEARQTLQNRLEYDTIAKDILSLQSQPELQKCIEEVNNEIDTIVSQIESIDTRTRERYSECAQVLDSVQSLVESVSCDIKEFE